MVSPKGGAAVCMCGLFNLCHFLLKVIKYQLVVYTLKMQKFTFFLRIVSIIKKKKKQNWGQKKNKFEFNGSILVILYEFGDLR